MRHLRIVDSLIIDDEIVDFVPHCRQLYVAYPISGTAVSVVKTKIVSDGLKHSNREAAVQTHFYINIGYLHKLRGGHEIK